MKMLIESKSKKLNTKKVMSESKKPRRKSVLENRKYAPFRPFTDKDYEAFSGVVEVTEDFIPLIYDGDDERYEIVIAKNQYYLNLTIFVFIFEAIPEFPFLDGFELYRFAKRVYTVEQAIELARKKLIPAFTRAKDIEDLFDICIDYGFALV